MSPRTARGPPSMSKRFPAFAVATVLVSASARAAQDLDVVPSYHPHGPGAGYVEIFPGDALTFEVSLPGMDHAQSQAAAGGWMTPKEKLVPHKHFKDEQWNTYRVLAQGARIQVWINDQQISDLTHEEKFKSHPKGFIGLQVHSIRKDSGPFEVRWRNLEIIELK